MTVTTQTSGASCGCSEYTQSRRAFLRNAGALAGAGVLTSAFGGAFVEAALASPGAKKKKSNIMIVLSLRGGADGLSLIVPHSDPEYARARGSIAIPTGALLGKDADFGLHPKFAPLMPMWTAGTFAAVHSVGLNKPNRSHFAAMDLVEDADVGSSERRGWLNRLIGLDKKASPIEGVQMGSPLVPTSLYGPEPVFAISDIDDMFLPGREKPEDYAMRVASLKQAFLKDKTSLGRGARGALEMSEKFEGFPEDDGTPEHGAVYPGSDLGKAMAATARLIRAEIGAEVITVDDGAWDMHIDVGTPDHGQMTIAAGDLAASVAAFFTDLGPTYLSRVTLVTVTEFGRRVQANESGGLDHGWGSAMLLFGAGVKGGRYYAPGWRGLAEEMLTDGDITPTRDYRTVLSEVVKSRFKADLSKVFPGFSPEPLGVMTGV